VPGTRAGTPLNPGRAAVGRNLGDHLRSQDRARSMGK
jgi:hypothetical protein